MTEYTAQQKLDALNRELHMRQRVYPGYVQRGRMTQQQSDYQIDILKSIIADYEKLAAGEKLL